MLVPILIAVGALVVLLLIYAATRPDVFRVERSTLIQAPAAKVYALIDDFHAWKRWSPWEALDPNMKRTHEGAPSGVGAKYGWHGDKKVGRGAMEITAAKPHESITIKLDFFEPFEAHNTVTFALKAAGGGTQVVWAMDGRQVFFLKLMGVFMSMDKMVGKDYEKGLAAMKAVAEG